ncbi:MAG: hypothetical protein V3U76_08265 [Granulosicoccus sp.]
MPARNTPGWITSLMILTLTGCTETIIHEIPADQDAPASAWLTTVPAYDDRTNLPAQTTGSQASAQTPTHSNNEQAQNALTTGNSQDAQATATSPVTPATTGSSDVISDEYQPIPLTNLAQTDDGSVVGDSGRRANCRQTLPCRWISADDSFSITATSADNTGSLGHLSINYRVDTLHDSSVVLGNSPAAIGAGGTTFTITEQALGTGNGIAPVAIEAGLPILGSLTYERAANDNSLAEWALTVLDNGMIREAKFTNLPLGPITTETAACNNTLPCIWASADKSVVITLLSAGGFSSTGRLTVNLTIETTADTRIALDAGATALASDGTVLDGRTHRLGTLNGYEQLTITSLAGTAVGAAVSFNRTQTQPVHLRQLSVVVYENTPTPRWNPTFENVPVL